MVQPAGHSVDDRDRVMLTVATQPGEALAHAVGDGAAKDRDVEVHEIRDVAGAEGDVV